jgi:hypothetical protein
MREAEIFCLERGEEVMIACTGVTSEIFVYIYNKYCGPLTPLRK